MYFVGIGIKKSVYEEEKTKSEMFICVLYIEIIQDCLIDVLPVRPAVFIFICFPIRKKGFVLNLCTKIKNRCYVFRILNLLNKTEKGKKIINFSVER